MAWCCARRMRTPRSSRSTPRRPKPRPACCAVLTAADVKAAGSATCPLPAASSAATARRMYKPRYPILAEDRVRWVGDCVAFVVAETVAQAHGCRRTDRGRLRAAAGGHLHRRGAQTRRAARVGRLPRQYLLRRTDRRQGRDRCRLCARRRTSSSIASSSTASPPPPWSRAARSATTTRPTAATPSTRRCSARIRSAPICAKLLKVPESKVRIITGDTGGSFGMKSPIFNESAAGAAGLQTHRPAGEMDQHAHRKPS